MRSGQVSATTNGGSAIGTGRSTSFKCWVMGASRHRGAASAIRDDANTQGAARKYGTVITVPISDAAEAGGETYQHFPVMVFGAVHVGWRLGS